MIKLTENKFYTKQLRIFLATLVHKIEKLNNMVLLDFLNACLKALFSV